MEPPGVELDVLEHHCLLCVGAGIPYQVDLLHQMFWSICYRRFVFYPYMHLLVRVNDFYLFYFGHLNRHVCRNMCVKYALTVSRTIF